MKPIKLSDLIEAIEFESDECTTLLDLQEGELVRVEHSIIRAVEEEDEESLGDVPDWQKPMVETARAIVADTGERFVDAPSKFDFHEYRHMERFIRTVEDRRAAEELLRAVKGKGAFRHFKDTASRLGLLDQWFRYRDEAMKEFAAAWAEGQEIPFMDDIKPSRP